MVAPKAVEEDLDAVFGESIEVIIAIVANRLARGDLVRLTVFAGKGDIDIFVIVENVRDRLIRRDRAGLLIQKSLHFGGGLPGRVGEIAVNGGRRGSFHAGERPSDVGATGILRMGAKRKQ